jgi:hypothetical protein
MKKFLEVSGESRQIGQIGSSTFTDRSAGASAVGVPSCRNGDIHCETTLFRRPRLPVCKEPVEARNERKLLPRTRFGYRVEARPSWENEILIEGSSE